MSPIPQNPFDGLILDEEEQEIENSLEEYVQVANFQESKKLLEDAARQYLNLNTSKPITLRVNQMDLIKIRAKAKRNNIPYQTLLGAVLHDFATDKRELVIK
jgi:predicted DNA binding CopG/RHH family protein